MSRKEQNEVDTFTIGPSVCGNFRAGKDICHHCVAGGCYLHYICFARPTVRRTTVQDEQDRLRAIAEIAGGET